VVRIGARVGAVVVLLGLVGCKDERPRAGEPKPTMPRRAELREMVVASDVEDDADSAATAGAAVDVVPEVAAPSGAQSDDVNEVTCKAACQNALHVTLAELPVETTEVMRAELVRVLETTCPSQCVARGSLASVRCVAQARTALELAACPR